MSEFRLGPSNITYLGRDLSRPECIVAEKNGTLWVSDNRAAVTRVDPDGTQTLIGTMGGKPNGMAMAGDGTLYLANIAHRKFYRLHRDGRHEVLLDEIDGRPVGAANFVLRDHRDCLWLSVSTVTDPHLDALERDIPDGYVIKIDELGARSVVGGLLFTNEIRISPDGRFLYMAETRAGRISRAEIRADGSLGYPEPFGPDPLDLGAKVDGIAFDSEGNLWVTEIAGNRLYVIDLQGKAHTVFEDPGGGIIDHPSSLTFVGADLRTVLVGSLTMDRIATFRSPIPGQPMRHWSDN
ncbi:MAG: SMP-30/gluconolactonase/LRE family protein [Betaproteobacteria bacterium]|nr:SMP-30/gluconolactonase/LRE family protein [Betaproteobacteria bacterium]